MSGKITDRFRDIIELEWDDFRDIETSPDVTNFDSIVASLVRACKKGNLRAIQVALDRLDGKIATEIEVEYPKFYTLYPQATKLSDDPSIITIGGIGITGVNKVEVIDIDIEPAVIDEEQPSGSLRGTLEKMLNAPKTIVSDILGWADKVDAGDLSYGNPFVKSVIVAGLMKLVHDGKVSAVFEVFDQIDGKVADKIKILGDDVYLINYASIAPAGAELNADGVYQLEANNVTDSWVTRLEETNNGKRR